ncbi:hypothetical protein [Bradyrhizobium pachyrhizi]|uniref:hypothetical protein n=1 Tax=Bradyrhizobium pachyrhizi TaxID=280333 RepID=UPI00128F764C|nr:hypothetical protein [Bradyrhizobium pachyrhizi]
MKLRLLLPGAFAFFLLASPPFASSQTSGGCTADMKLIDCVKRIADLAQSFGDKLSAVYTEISRRELPVGTVIASILPPDVFLSSKNPQFDSSRWVPADGKVLPANSIYQQMTQQAYAPDLRSLSRQRIVLDVVDGVAEAGQVVDQLRTPQFSDANWKFHFGLRNIQGNRANNDFEQDVDNFEVMVDNGKVVAHGRTLNWKHGVWGNWANGSTNFMGIATVASPFYYYVKIN